MTTQETNDKTIDTRSIALRLAEFCHSPRWYTGRRAWFLPWVLPCVLSAGIAAVVPTQDRNFSWIPIHFLARYFSSLVVFYVIRGPFGHAVHAISREALRTDVSRLDPVRPLINAHFAFGVVLIITEVWVRFPVFWVTPGGRLATLAFWLTFIPLGYYSAARPDERLGFFTMILTGYVAYGWFLMWDAIAPPYRAPLGVFKPIDWPRWWPFLTFCLSGFLLYTPAKSSQNTSEEAD